MGSMNTRFRIFSLATALAATLGAGTASAQTVSWDPRTGDVWVDTWLGDVNRYGTRYQQPFVDEMVRYYGAPRDLVTTLLGERGWAAGDVYYACAIAQLIGRPCRYVADQWQDNRGEGWGALAQRLGIKPGSPEFHRLKNGLVSSYDRWGRPIRIDEDLYDDYPERARLILERDDRDGPRRQVRSNRAGDNGHAASPSRGNPGNGNARAGRGNDEAGDRGRGHGGNEGQGRGNEGKGHRGNNGKGNGNKGNNGKGNGNNGNGRNG